MNAGSNLEAVRRWYEQTSGAYGASTDHGHDGLRDFFRELHEMLGEVRYAPPEFHPTSDDVRFGSHGEAMRGG